jgi:hypothetical protein
MPPPAAPGAPPPSGSLIKRVNLLRLLASHLRAGERGSLEAGSLTLAS